MLERKVAEMEGPLKLAVTRLVHRQQRNEVELCRDSATKGCFEISSL